MTKKARNSQNRNKGRQRSSINAKLEKERLITNVDRIKHTEAENKENAVLQSKHDSTNKTCPDDNESSSSRATDPCRKALERCHASQNQNDQEDLVFQIKEVHEFVQAKENQPDEKTEKHQEVSNIEGVTSANDHSTLQEETNILVNVKGLIDRIRKSSTSEEAGSPKTSELVVESISAFTSSDQDYENYNESKNKGESEGEAESGRDSESESEGKCNNKNTALDFGVSIANEAFRVTEEVEEIHKASNNEEEEEDAKIAEKIKVESKEFEEKREEDAKTAELVEEEDTGMAINEQEDTWNGENETTYEAEIEEPNANLDEQFAFAQEDVKKSEADEHYTAAQEGREEEDTTTGSETNEDTQIEENEGTVTAYPTGADKFYGTAQKEEEEEADIEMAESEEDEDVIYMGCQLSRNPGPIEVIVIEDDSDKELEAMLPEVICISDDDESSVENSVASLHDDDHLVGFSDNNGERLVQNQNFQDNGNLIENYVEDFVENDSFDEHPVDRSLMIHKLTSIEEAEATNFVEKESEENLGLEKVQETNQPVRKEEMDNDSPSTAELTTRQNVKKKIEDTFASRETKEIDPSNTRKQETAKEKRTGRAHLRTEQLHPFSLLNLSFCPYAFNLSLLGWPMQISVQLPRLDPQSKEFLWAHKNKNHFSQCVQAGLNFAKEHPFMFAFISCAGSIPVILIIWFIFAFALLCLPSVALLAFYVFYTSLKTFSVSVKESPDEY